MRQARPRPSTWSARPPSLTRPRRPGVRGLFVTATDTGVGKTVLSAALSAALIEAGESVRAHKPVVTGLDEQPPGAAICGSRSSASDGDARVAERQTWPADHELLGAITGAAPDEVAPQRYRAAAAPHLAAQLAGERIDADELLAAAADAEARASGAAQTLIVEGVGGLLTPLAERFTVRDLARSLGLPLLVAARPGLGTINHTLLTLQAARASGLVVRAVVLTPWPAQAGALELSNRDTITRLGDVEVALLRHIAGPDPGALARAGAGLPWRRWLE
ncbi:MAG: dethiobiotin synthase [Actinobacteria bacterium]|nr:MAG: dethiobiotin synthase [Actinomycetota bacterium]